MTDAFYELPDDMLLKRVQCSTRIRNVLEFASLKTVGDIRSASDAALLKPSRSREGLSPAPPRSIGAEVEELASVNHPAAWTREEISPGRPNWCFRPANSPSFNQIRLEQNDRAFRYAAPTFRDFGSLGRCGVVGSQTVMGLKGK